MFKTLFVSFSLLTLCILPFSDTGHTKPHPAIFDGTPIKFKVYVDVSQDDSILEKRLQTFVKRELRALGDVSVVSLDDDWHFMLIYSILEITRKSDGTKTGDISIAEGVYMALPKSRLENYNIDLHGRPVYPLVLNPSFWGADKLLELAILSVGKFDELLAEFREK